MTNSRLSCAVAIIGLLLATGALSGTTSALAQSQQTAATPSDTTPAETAAPEPLSDEELQVLVARIALYPDELVALVAAASLYPLQIVEAERFLEKRKKQTDLEPPSDWDGSVISLLNYPDIVKMMSEDLDWTEELGDAITNQQKDVLEAIQVLREKAVATGAIKSNDKMKIVEQQDNIVIQPASTEKIYVPQYPPEMLYEENYPVEPIYYSDPYPYYYDPAAPFFAGFFTGAIFGAIIDWNDWGIWGGDWDGGDLNIDCNNCFNDNRFNGKLDFNNADWKNIDRSKINFDKSQFKNLDRNKFKNSLEGNNRNNLKNKAGDLKRNHASTLPANNRSGANDIRKSTLEGLKSKPGQGAGNKMAKPGQGAGKPSAGNRPASKPGGGSADRPSGKPKAGTANRPSGKPKAGGKVDSRPKNSSPLGDVNRGSKAKYDSNRGRQSMGGGMRSGGGAQKRYIPPRGGGGGGGRGGGRR
jgi:hypothetical protein